MCTKKTALLATLLLLPVCPLLPRQTSLDISNNVSITPVYGCSAGVKHFPAYHLCRFVRCLCVFLCFAFLFLLYMLMWSPKTSFSSGCLFLSFLLLYNCCCCQQQQNFLLFFFSSSFFSFYWLDLLFLNVPTLCPLLLVCICQSVCLFLLLLLLLFLHTHKLHFYFPLLFCRLSLLSFLLLPLLWVLFSN